MLLVQSVKRPHQHLGNRPRRMALHLGNRLLKTALHLGNQLTKMVQLLDSLQLRTPVHLVGLLKALELHHKLGHLVVLVSHQLWAKSQVPLVVLLDSLHT